jgi:osmotically-inducible protein OsmY
MHPAMMSDDALARRVWLCLRTRGVCGAEQVVIKASGGVVILCGQLPSPEAKRVCVECCRHVAGAIHVVDQLNVA